MTAFIPTVYLIAAVAVAIVLGGAAHSLLATTPTVCMAPSAASASPSPRRGEGRGEGAPSPIVITGIRGSISE